LNGHDPSQQAGQRFEVKGADKWMGAALERAAAKRKRGMAYVSGIHQSADEMPVEATAIPELLFERGLYRASGRSGLADIVAVPKWFNLAALKGHGDVIALRHEVAEQKSDEEIIRAQRNARAWR
jgi:hypothetical protein